MPLYDHVFFQGGRGVNKEFDSYFLSDRKNTRNLILDGMWPFCFCLYCRFVFNSPDLCFAQSLVVDVLFVYRL